MSNSIAAPSLGNNNGHPSSLSGWGSPSRAQSSAPLSDFHATSSERVNYALRAIARHESLTEALQFGCAEGRNPVSDALLDAGYHVQASLWAAFVSCYRRYGHLRDRNLLRLTAVEEQATYRVEQTTANELRALIDDCFEGDTPDLTAARNAVSDLLELLLVNRVEAREWAEWTSRQDRTPNEFLPGLQVMRETIAHFRAGAEARGPYSTTQFRERVRTREEIITGVLVANQLGLIGAATKSLKTLLCEDAAISIGTGTPWLGYSHWACERTRRVGFFSAESGAETLLRKHDLIAAVKRNALPESQREAFDRNLASNILWDDQVPDLSDAASLERFRQTIARERLEVVFVDPLSMAIGAAAKDLANMSVTAQVVLRAAHICQRTNCTLILVHHTAGDRVRMASERARGPLDLADIAYPGVTNFCRQWVTLNRAEAYNEEHRRSVLWLRAAGSGLQTGGTFRVTVTEGHRHDRWDVQVETEAQSIERQRSGREQEQRQEDRADRERILEYLQLNPGATVNAMCRGGELPGIGAIRLRRFLLDLQSHGTVRCESGPQNRQLWYRVVRTAGVVPEGQDRSNSE